MYGRAPLPNNKFGYGHISFPDDIIHWVFRGIFLLKYSLYALSIWFILLFFINDIRGSIPKLISYKWEKTSGKIYIFGIKPDLLNINCLFVYFKFLSLNSPMKIKSGKYSQMLLVNFINNGFGYISSLKFSISNAFQKPHSSLGNTIFPFIIS